MTEFRRCLLPNTASSQTPSPWLSTFSPAHQRLLHWRVLLAFTTTLILGIQFATASLSGAEFGGAFVAASLIFTVVVTAVFVPLPVFRGFLLVLALPVLINVVPFFASLKAMPNTGWSARKEFEGYPLETAIAFGPPVTALLLLALFGFLFSRLRLVPVISRTSQKQQTGSNSGKHTNSNRAVLVLVLVILGYLGFLWMDLHGIGTPGYQAGYLPFKLVGITYYGMLLLPIVISALVAKQPPGALVRCLTPGLPLIAGLTTSSRTFVLVWTLPVLLILARKFSWPLLLSAVASVSLGLHATIIVRGFRYSTARLGADSVAFMPSIAERLQTIIMQIGDIHERVLASVTRIAGPQEIVLAAQFSRSQEETALNQLVAFFWSPAGHAYSHEEWHLSWFGFVPPDGFAAGPGTVGKLGLLFHHGVLPVIIVVAVVSVLLASIDIVMKMRTPLSNDPKTFRVVSYLLGAVLAMRVTAVFNHSIFLLSAFLLMMVGLLMRLLRPTLQRLRRRAKSGLSELYSNFGTSS